MKRMKKKVPSNSEHLTIIVREGIGVGIQPITVQQDGGVRQHHAGGVIVVEFLACDFLEDQDRPIRHTRTGLVGSLMS